MSNVQESVDREEVVVIVHLDVQIGSTILTNFYRNSISKFKINSSIIVNDNIALSNELIHHTNSKTIPQLLYRGTRDGFKAADFHSKCDNQGPTLTIIKSSVNALAIIKSSANEPPPYSPIFGGFTTNSWKSPSFGQYISDSSAFIFKIENVNQSMLFRKFDIKQKGSNNINSSIFVGKGYMPIFGEGLDICISNDCNLNNNSYSNFGYSYELPVGIEFKSDQSRGYLAGSYKFKVLEIEVFKISTTTTIQ